jgi:hypothetical protein
VVKPAVEIPLSHTKKAIVLPQMEALTCVIDRHTDLIRGKSMRFIVATFMFIASLLPVGALADDAQGTITKIDEDNSTITLDDGKVYKLPGEFDLSVIEQGMKVTLMFDVVNKERFITDIEETTE